MGHSERFVQPTSCGKNTWTIPGWRISHSPFEVKQLLWVREKHSLWKSSSVAASSSDATYCCFPDGSQRFRSGKYYDFVAEDPAWPSYVKWRPSIHMPRWASRIMLEVTDVRVERVQDISDEDVIAEGIKRLEFEGWRIPGDTFTFHFSALAFARLWDSLNAKRGHGWDQNFWVWVVEFKRLGQT